MRKRGEAAGLGPAASAFSYRCPFAIRLGRQQFAGHGVHCGFKRLASVRRLDLQIVDHFSVFTVQFLHGHRTAGIGGLGRRDGLRLGDLGLSRQLGLLDGVVFVFLIPSLRLYLPGRCRRRALSIAAAGLRCLRRLGRRAGIRF